MKTVKLYENDAYIKSFEAEVLSCEKCDVGYKLLLDKTAFFPEGGGQPSDTGTLSGAAVSDVRIENGGIFHCCTAPFTEGERVVGEIDFPRRFNFMQNHTAEHIVSGLVYEKFGFDNIGFHLNENEVTFDFNGFFTSEQLDELEYEANVKVWQNLPVTAYYPAVASLKNIHYRAKAGIGGEIRLVEIKDTDICACCAPHVKNTGEIGLIKFLGTENQHGGTRIFMKCGAFALKDYRAKTEDVKSICEILSAKPQDVKNAVLSQSARLDREKQSVKEIKSELFGCMIKLFDKTKPAMLLPAADIKDLQIVSDGLHRTYGGVRTAFCENQTGASFVMCGDEPEIESEFRKLKNRFDVKGGGRGGIRQGSITAPVDEIKTFFGVRE